MKYVDGVEAPLCERGELPHVWVVNSIRIRPSDLQAFLEQEPVGGERGDG